MRNRRAVAAWLKPVSDAHLAQCGAHLEGRGAEGRLDGSLRTQQIGTRFAQRARGGISGGAGVAAKSMMREVLSCCVGCDEVNRFRP